MNADLLLVNGRVFSFGRKEILGKTLQIAVSSGKVIFVGTKFNGQATKTIDLKGAWISRRLWDVHAHVGRGWGPWATTYPGLENLIEVVLDAGTVPPLMIEAYQDAVIQPARPQFTVGLFTSVSRHGLCSGTTHDYRSHHDADPSLVRNAMVKYSTDVFGTKARVDSDTTAGRLDLTPIQIGIKEARAASERVGKRRLFMLHHSSGIGDPPLDYLLDGISPEDAPFTVLTHAMRGVKLDARRLGMEFGNSILDVNGKVRPCVVRFCENGGRLDHGNGMAGISFLTFQKARDQGVHLNFASTDYHALCYENVRGLLHMMSQFVALGMEPVDVLRIALANPAASFDMPEFAEIVKGSPANFAVFSLRPEAVRFTDGVNETVTGSKKFVAHLNLKDGEIIYTGVAL